MGETTNVQTFNDEALFALAQTPDFQTLSRGLGKDFDQQAAAQIYTDLKASYGHDSALFQRAIASQIAMYAETPAGPLSVAGGGIEPTIAAFEAGIS